MAHCLRRPVLSTTRLQLSIGLQQRAFGVLPPRWAVESTRQMRPQQPRTDSGRSVRIASKEMMQFPSDIGLLPATFVAPSGANRPKLFKQPVRLFRLQWTRLKSKTRDFLTLLIYKFQTKPWLKLQSGRTVPTAVGLHRRMYTAFAEGDLPMLSKMCGEGLLASFHTRIISRPNGERWEWEIVRYNKRPRVMSHRGASLGMEGFGIRQAVVRISSRQKLTRYRRDGTVVPTSGKEKDVTEYIVVQRNMKDSKEQDWIIWGTTEETILEKFQEEQVAQLMGDR